VTQVFPTDNDVRRPAASEVELCAELKLSTAAGIRDVAEATGVAPGQPCRAATVRGEEELRRICGAKCLQTQVQIAALRKSDRLGQCGIQIEKAGPAEIVPPHIAECSASRSRET